MPALPKLLLEYSLYRFGDKYGKTLEVPSSKSAFTISVLMMGSGYLVHMIFDSRHSINTLVNIQNCHLNTTHDNTEDTKYSEFTIRRIPPFAFYIA